MAPPQTNTHTITALVQEVVKAANFAHMYQGTLGRYGLEFITIRPKTAEITNLK